MNNRGQTLVIFVIILPILIIICGIVIELSNLRKETVGRIIPKEERERINDFVLMNTTKQKLDDIER